MSKFKKIIITAWMLEVPGYSIWIEAKKWLKIFQEFGYKIELVHGRDPRYKFIGRENKELLDLQTRLFKKQISYNDLIKNKLVNQFYKKTVNLFERKWQEEKFILVAENSFGPALNIPYSKGLLDVINKLSIPTIARIHDFYVNFYTQNDAEIKDSISDLKNVYEANSKNIYKIFINQSDLEQAKKRKIDNIYLIPNAFKFGTNVNVNRKNIENIKKKINFKSSELIFLQPTRIISRKRIEDVLFILSKLQKKINRPIKFLIAGGFNEYNPETIGYINKISKQAKKYKIPAFILKDLGIEFNIQDAYFIADFVTLFSAEEGFGLPVLESCAYKKPLIVRRYPRFSIFEHFSEGEFNFIKTANPNHPWEWPQKELNNFVTLILNWLKKDKKEQEKILEKNYLIARNHFSLQDTKTKLKSILTKIEI